MIRINQLKLNIAHTQSDLERKILKTLHMKKEYLQGYKIRRQSIDARKKPDLYYVYSVDVLVKVRQKSKKASRVIRFNFRRKKMLITFLQTEPESSSTVLLSSEPDLRDYSADICLQSTDTGQSFWKEGPMSINALKT